MPELVSNGPRIPVSVMNEADSGDVVFFCGAGVSMDRSSKLPSFAQLVRHIYAKNSMVPDAVEAEALDCDEPNENRRRPFLDKALGLLERPNRLGPQALRRTVVERLSKPPSGELSVHKALIELGRTEHGVRLITTNFDNRFVEAGPNIRLVDAAPKLPVPKRHHNWSSLVHLHGRIVEGDDGSNLVLTAADFGRAYLTERWAARFVAELFREFTVLFVGYGVNDPVMAYLVDALAAERDKGAQIARAYAFADHDGSPEGIERARNGWLAKKVEPILYEHSDGHRLLAETLMEWARIRNDPFQARSKIALNGISKMPAGRNDPVVERMIWALKDPVAAKALAFDPPIVDENDYSKIEEWLEMFTQGGLLQCAPANTQTGAGTEAAAFVRLVDRGFESETPNNLDTTRRYLALWIARHLHVPQVLAWVLRNGGRLHPSLRNSVHGQLGDPSTHIAPKLRLLWTVVSNQEPEDTLKFLSNPLQYTRADSVTERRCIEYDAIESVAPRLIAVPGPTARLEFERHVTGESRPVSPIEACGHLKLTVGNDDSRYQVEEILQSEDVLARHAETLTGYLDQALALAHEDDEVDPDSSLYRPSIAKHDQNRHHDEKGLNHLIDLVRDGYRALAGSDRMRAANLLHRWAMSKQPLFRRLALHALTENPKSDIHLTKKLLVAGRRPGVWESELRRETLRFLRRAGSRLPRSLRPEIVQAIRAGPKTKPRTLPPGYDKRIRKEQALRLHKLASSGAPLDRKAGNLAGEHQPPAQGEPSERDEFTAWRGGARSIGEGELAPDDLLDGNIDDIATALENERIGQEASRGLAAAKPVKVVRALRRLTSDDKWPAMYWQWVLWTTANSAERRKPNARLQKHVAHILAKAPDELLAGVGSAAAEFVKGLANAYDTDREQEVATLWTKAWNALGMGEPAQIADSNDPITDALNDPAGKLADAAVSRLLKYEPSAGDGLPAPVRPYFDAIAANPRGHLGRVMLAMRLPYLFAVDQDWTKSRLVPLLSLGGSAEATNLWYAYGWSRTIGPDLLQAIKEPFLEVLRDGEVGVRTKHNLTMIFMAICLEAPNELAQEELRGVLASMTEQDLKTVLECLTQRLTGEAAEQAQVWREKVSPWLESYWPPAAARNTAATSKGMLNMLAACGDAFPEAAAWSLNYLQPTQGDLFHLRDSVQLKRHPEVTLQILNQVVRQGGVQPQHRTAFRVILETMRAAMPPLATDVRFQRLFQVATE